MSVNQGGGGSSPVSAGNSIYRAVVTDVFTLGASDGVSIGELVNPEKLEGAPPNTCIVKLYGGASQNSVVAYPFFPPHIAVPVKPGESVWVISPALLKPDPKECFWVCKIATQEISSDINFSHPFRINAGQDVDDPSTRLSNVASSNQSATDKKVKPSFSNDTENGPAVLPEKTGKNPIDAVLKSNAYKILNLEPSPMFYKRPGDLTLQGSNNALVSLGEDRGYAISDFELSGSNPQSTVKAKSFSGTVDIVAGRSRYLPVPGVGVTRTQFETIENTRNYLERNKEKISYVSGDVDFAVDASRLYVSMLTDGDYNFGLLNHMSASVDRMPASIVTGSIQPASGSAYIIAKSDEIRLIARRQTEGEYFPVTDSYPGNPEINGSIKIIKEGKKDGDLAAVILQPDGSIQISGSRIFLGRHPDDGGLEESEAGPDDAAHVQPYVRYQQLEDLLNAIMDNIDAFCDTLNTHVTPGYGNPSPQILDAAAALKSDIASRREEIVTLKSSRIFGE